MGMNVLRRVGLAVADAANRRGIYLGRRSTRIHVWVYRRTAGRIGGSIPGFRGAYIALVDHVGAKSGTLRTTPLICVDDGATIVVAASKAGQPDNPAWFHNLMANPDTSVQIGAEHRHVHARLATAEERPGLWSQLVTAYQGFDAFARRAAPREIPIVLLERQSARG